MNFYSWILFSHNNPLSFKTFFLFSKILQRIIRINIIFFELINDDQHEQIHHNIGLCDDEEYKEHHWPSISLSNYIKHNRHPIFTSTTSEQYDKCRVEVAKVVQRIYYFARTIQTFKIIRQLIHQHLKAIYLTSPKRKHPKMAKIK